jgi:hypothetical protein
MAQGTSPWPALGLMLAQAVTLRTWGLEVACSNLVPETGCPFQVNMPV